MSSSRSKPSLPIDWFSNNEALTIKLLDLLQQWPKLSQVLWRNPGHPKPSATIKVEAASQLAELVFADLPEGERDIDFDGIAVSERIKQLRKRYYDLRRGQGLTDSKGRWRGSAESVSGELVRDLRESVLRRCPYFMKLVELNGDIDECGMEVTNEGADPRAAAEDEYKEDDHDDDTAEEEEEYQSQQLRDLFDPPEQPSGAAPVPLKDKEVVEPISKLPRESSQPRTTHDKHTPQTHNRPDESVRIMQQLTIANLHEILSKRIKIMDRLDPVYATLRRQLGDKNLTHEQQINIKFQMSAREAIFCDRVHEQMWPGLIHGKRQHVQAASASLTSTDISQVLVRNESSMIVPAVALSRKRPLPDDENTNISNKDESRQTHGSAPGHDRETADNTPPSKKVDIRHERHQRKMQIKSLKLEAKLEAKRLKRKAKERGKERKHELAMMDRKIRLAEIENGFVGGVKSTSKKK